MARKKKISMRVKGYNIALICVLIVLIVSMTTVLVTVMFKSKAFYKVESRQQEIKENKKTDTEGYSTMGWVRVQGTNIDYPLYALNEAKETFPETKSMLWDLSLDGKFHNVMLLYGHNIQNLSSHPLKHDKTFIRLEELMNYVYYDFAKENKYFQVTIGDKDYVYKIFGVNFMGVDQFYGYSRTDYTKADKKHYINEVLKDSIYDYDIDVDENDDIASIVTCSHFFETKSNNFLITGRLVRKNEKVDDYSVYRNKNYTEKILPILEGEGIGYEE